MAPGLCSTSTSPENLTAFSNSTWLVELFATDAMPDIAMPEMVTGAVFAGNLILVAANALPLGFSSMASVALPITAVPLAGTSAGNHLAPSFKLPLAPPIHTWSSALAHTHHISVF